MDTEFVAFSGRGHRLAGPQLARSLSEPIDLLEGASSQRPPNMEPPVEPQPSVEPPDLASGWAIVTELMEEVNKMSTVVRAWLEQLGDGTWDARLKGACGTLLSEMAPLVEMANT